MFEQKKEMCKQCGKEWETVDICFLTLAELGKARALVYGFEFNSFCSDLCSSKFYGNAPTITPEEFASVDIEKLKKMNQGKRR